MPITAPHPDPHVLAAFARGDLPPAEIAAVADHVAGCDACCAAVGRVPDDPLVGLARRAAADTPSGADAPALPFPLPGPDAVPAALAGHPRYKVLAELGAGGMGVVYKAEHTVMGRVVALKVVAPHLTARAAAVERFRREVKAAGRLTHPNIVTAHDADAAGGLHFLVMEYVDGVSLDRLVRRRGPLPAATAAQIGRQAALGLQHAHEKGMVHRDVKPQNLMVSRKGQVKILDFGLARFARTPEPGGPPGTAASQLLGTPEYLSPEQARNAAAVDTRSDIYSLGCTLYFLLTARVPFPNAASLIDTLLAHTRDDPEPVRSLRPDVPEGLAAVVAKMMAKKPDDRYRTPAEVAAALHPFTKDAAPPGEPNPFALDTTPDAGPRVATVAEGVRWPRATPRPIARRAAAAAIAAVALAVGVAVVKSGKNANPPATAGGGNSNEREGTADRTATKGGGPVVPAKRQKVLFVLPTNGVWLPDYTGVRAEFDKADVDLVVTAGSKDNARPHPDTPGPHVPVDAPIWAVQNLDDYAAVMICGGDVSEYLTGGRGADNVKRIVGHMEQAGKPVGAICTGVAVLASHGVPKGRRVAHSPHTKQHFGDFPGTNWRYQSVVADGTLITARGPEEAGAFAREVLRAIGAK